MKIDAETCKKEFCELLRSTGRPGVDDVIADLESMGFFSAPASAGHHLNVAGGLTQHSLNACNAALKVWEGLSHDVCKSDIYFRSVKKRKNSLGQWEDSEGYKVSYRSFPMGHGEKSVIMVLLSGLELSDAEMLAIRWHMGAWGVNQNSLEDCKNYDAARKLYPLVAIVQAGDSLAASILERSAGDTDDI